MMNMFAKFLTNLSLMKAYWNHIFKKDKVRMICRHTGATIVHLVGVKDEAFSQNIAQTDVLHHE